MAQRTEKDLWVEMSITEIAKQAHFAKIAYSHISPKVATGNDAVFSSIHSFLAHSTLISKMLSATDGGTPQKTIGDVLGVPASSLVHKRTFRNHLEHYDERLQSWIKKFGPNVNIGLTNIGPREVFANLPNTVVVSHYDPNKNLFTFVNDDFDLGALETEVTNIQALAEKWAEGKLSGTITVPYI